MPTYDYQCRQCGRTTEVIHSMLEDGPTTCEHCGGQLRRVLHPAGIIFKGSGFYRTDSRTAVGGGSERSRGSDRTAETKSDRRPEGGAGSTESSGSAEKSKETGSESASTPSSE